MESAQNGIQSRLDDERARHVRRMKLKELNATHRVQGMQLAYRAGTYLSYQVLQLESEKLDSSLKRHTALIKRIRQSMAADNKEQILKDIDSLSLEKYIDEIAGAVVEGLSRCKTEKDVWGAVEVHTKMPNAMRRVSMTVLDHLPSASPFSEDVYS